MPSCTFFGHGDCPDTIRPGLRGTLVDLIVRDGVDMFYVGHQGRFDAIVRSVLRELKDEYPQIRYAVVLAYMPGKTKRQEDHSDTMIPEGLERVHPRYGVSWRNDWMLRRSDYVVTYVTHSWGGAAKYARKARAAGRTILQLQ